MILSRKLSVLFVLGLVSLFYTTGANACACCAERGIYIEGPEKLDDWIAEGFGKLQFEGASVYNPSGEPVSLNGVKSKADSFGLKLDVKKDVWAFVFLDQKTGKEVGRFTIKPPSQLHRLTADLERVPEKEKPGVKVYTRLGIKADAKGSGIFTKNRNIEFILHQTEGNVCLDVEGASHYTLIIGKGEKSFHFYGNLKKKH